MRIAITGAKGQLGRSLETVLRGETPLPLDLPEWDLTHDTAMEHLVSLAPDLVIHAAAMTDVDGCELSPEAASTINAEGTRRIALACQRLNAPMVYVSTDYVFDGTKDEPYLEGDEPNPTSVYGKSKLAGERYVQDTLEKYYIARTAWLYAPGGRNFVERVIQLSQEREELYIVTTEVGSPTYAPDLAQAVSHLIQHPVYGIYHLANEGSCSRYQFAKRILELAGKPDFPLHPTDHYPRPAKVPPHAILANTRARALGIRLRPWPEALPDYFHERTDG